MITSLKEWFFYIEEYVTKGFGSDTIVIDGSVTMVAMVLLLLL